MYVSAVDSDGTLERVVDRVARGVAVRLIAAEMEVDRVARHVVLLAHLIQLHTVNAKLRVALHEDMAAPSAISTLH